MICEPNGAPNFHAGADGFVSDGEGTGHVAIAWWQPREPNHQTRIVTADVPEELRKNWNKEGRDIAEIECVAPLLAFKTWPQLRDGLWIHFTDNEAAKAAFTRGASPIYNLNEITHEMW